VKKKAGISTKECADIMSGHSEICPDTYPIDQKLSGYWMLLRAMPSGLHAYVGKHHMLICNFSSL